MCSTFGIRDFPIVNSVPVTPSLQAKLYEEIALDIQWGPKATEPTFIHDGAYANLGFLELLSPGASTTTLRLQGNSFSLISVQLCEPQHKSLLIQANQRDCSGEIVMGFKAAGSISESYVFLCIPILAKATTSPSVYLEALRMERLDGKPTSLLSVLPKDTHFISYSTCLQRLETSGTSTTQARVLVFTEGLAYPPASFAEIASMIVKPPPSGVQSLPAIQLPDSLVDTSQALLFTITTETEYTSLLRYSQYYPKGQPDSSQYRTDTLDSYKCVPLEPSKTVKDGKIIVDTDSGELLSQVLKDDTVGTPSQSRITPALVEKILAVCIAVILVSFVLFVIAYAVASMTTGNAETFFGILRHSIPTVAPIVFFSILLGVVGFVLGFALQSMI